jgi:hypothetical protein
MLWSTLGALASCAIAGIESVSEELGWLGVEVLMTGRSAARVSRAHETAARRSREESKAETVLRGR